MKTTTNRYGLPTPITAAVGPIRGPLRQGRRGAKAVTPRRKRKRAVWVVQPTEQKGDE